MLMAPEDDGNGSAVVISSEQDIVYARRAGMDLCARIGFTGTEQVKVATAISELARNIFLYAGTGEVSVRRIAEPRLGVEVVASDDGPGFVFEETLKPIRRRRGMGLGLIGTKRLMDYFLVDSSPGSGTRVTIRKFVSR